jgi:hypothetical protein
MAIRDGWLTLRLVKTYSMLSKTIDYLDAFSRFKKKENVEAVERLLSAHKEFHKFERAQLGMLFAPPSPALRLSSYRLTAPTRIYSGVGRVWNAWG